VKLDTVRFRGWTQEAGKFNGTLVLIPGRHGDGRGMAGDPKWQALTEELGFAILACQFADGDPGLYQFDTQGEVADAINEAVSRLAKESGHPELENAPLALWGTSAGSNASSRYCARYPTRVAAFASSKGTYGPGDVPAAAFDIPMFFAVGQKDNPEFVSVSLDNIKKGLGRAPWTLALSPTEGHKVGGSLEVAIPFLSATVHQRLGLAAPNGGSGTSDSIFKSQLPMTSGASGGSGAASKKLEKIVARNGWLGDPENFEVAPYQDYKGAKSKAIWLPDEVTAKAWQSYLRK